MRTTDVDFINGMMTHPDIYPFITDDGAGPPEEYSVEPLVANELFYFLTPNEYTLFVLIPVNSVTWEFHTCILKPGRGQRADESFQAMARYMFTQTPCLKLMSWGPEGHERALAYAYRNGCVKEGVNKSAWLKDGQLQDLILVGLSKENWQCQQ